MSQIPGFNGDIRQQENISPVPDEIGLWSGYPIGLKKIAPPINRDMVSKKKKMFNTCNYVKSTN